MGDIDPQTELNTALDHLLVLSRQDPEKLQKTLYDSFSALSYLALEGKAADFQPGWAAKVVGKDGNPIFKKEEADIVETVALNTVKPIFTPDTNSETQKGGDPSIKPIGTKGMIDVTSVPGIGVNPDDLSLDKTYWKVKNFLSGLDKQTHDLSRELGPFRFFYESPVDIQIPLPLPFPPYTITVPISPRAVPVIISALVEGIRLLFSFGPLSNDITRKILSIVMAVVDILQGEWKHSIMSLIGFYGSTPLAIGIVGKVFFNSLSLIAPDLQDRLLLDIYQSTKSMFIGIVLWGFATFSTAPIRKIVRTQFDKLKELADNANGQIGKIESSMQQSVDPLGLKVKFNKLPEGFVPTFDDIQNLQSIARQPAIYCSKEFQEAIAPLRVIPPARLILELFSIPTDLQTLEMECKGMAGISLEKTMESAMTPQITPADAPTAAVSEPAGSDKPAVSKDDHIKPNVVDTPIPPKPTTPKPTTPKPTTPKPTTKKGGKRSKKRRCTRRKSRTIKLPPPEHPLDRVAKQ